MFLFYISHIYITLLYIIINLMLQLSPSVFGVGKNPYYEKREEERKLKIAKRKMKERMESEDRKADL